MPTRTAYVIMMDDIIQYVILDNEQHAIESMEAFKVLHKRQLLQTLGILKDQYDANFCWRVISTEYKHGGRKNNR